MDKFEIGYEKIITSGKIDITHNFDIHLYVDMETKEEVVDAIHDYFWGNIVSLGDVRDYESKTTITIPEEFWDKWEDLKNEKINSRLAQTEHAG